MLCYIQYLEYSLKVTCRPYLCDVCVGACVCIMCVGVVIRVGCVRACCMCGVRAYMCVSVFVSCQTKYQFTHNRLLFFTFKIRWIVIYDILCT